MRIKRWVIRIGLVVVAISLVWLGRYDILGRVFFVLGIILLAVSIWGWFGFIVTVRMKQNFNITTPSEFSSMTLMGLGLIVLCWLPVLGYILFFIGFFASSILFRILKFTAINRYFNMMIGENDGRKELKRKEREEISHFMDYLARRDTLYGMVRVMCLSYFSYMVRWKKTRGENTFKPIYATRYALHSRNHSWSTSSLNSFLASVSSFKKLLLVISAQPDETPGRVEELRDWLGHQKEVNIPSVTWSKEEALESNIGYGKNSLFNQNERSGNNA